MGVHRLAEPIVSGKPADQVLIGFGVPTGVDTIGNAAEQPLFGFALQKAVQAATERWRGDFPGVGRADGGDVVGIGHAGIEQ